MTMVRRPFFLRTSLLICAGLTLVGLVQCTQLAGTVDETDTGRLAMLYNHDGTPAPYATIRAYNYRDTTLAYETLTAQDGSYSLASLSGTYAIWAEKDSLVAFQDSVYIQQSNRNIDSDTLKRPGSITARVQMQIGDPPTAVTVHALGTYAYANVSDSGWFTLGGLAEGRYHLQLSTSLAGYATTYSAPIAIRSGQETLVSQPIIMIYTSVPYVTGLKGTYDTLNGTIHLAWDSTSYPHFQEYVVYRRAGRQGSEPFFMHAVTNQTTFSESVGAASWDNEVTAYQYKVVIRDRFENEGRAYGHIQIQTCPVESILTSITYNGRCRILTLVDREVWVIANVRNPTRNLKQVVWKNESSQEILRERNLSGTVLGFTDTLRYTPSKHNDVLLSTSVMDAGGFVTTDTIMVSCKPAYAQLTCYNDTLTGVYPLTVFCDEGFASVSVSLGNRVEATAPVRSGMALCSLDTRTIYPSQSARLIVSAGPDFRDTSWVVIRNPDPLVGCWTGEKDSSIRECYYEDGRIQSNREYAWPMGWERRGERVVILQATSSSVTFTPMFIDYNHCILNGMSFIRNNHQ